MNLILAIVSMSYLNQQKKVEAENEERERRKIEDESELREEEARALSQNNNERPEENSLQFGSSTGESLYSDAINEYEQVSN